MSTFIRGNVLTISGTIRPKAGQIGTPSSVIATVRYQNLSGATSEDTINLSSSDGILWTGTWDSSRTKGGRVFWTIQSRGGLVAARDGSFIVDANASNHS